MLDFVQGTEAYGLDALKLARKVQSECTKTAHMTELFRCSVTLQRQRDIGTHSHMLGPRCRNADVRVKSIVVAQLRNVQRKLPLTYFQTHREAVHGILS